MSTRSISLIGWSILFAALFAWEGVAIARRPDGWVTISSLVETVRWAAVRWVLFALWIWVGWHVFIRTWQMLGGR